MQKSFINSNIDIKIKPKFQYYNGFTFSDNYNNDIKFMGNDPYFKEIQKSQEADIVINLANVNYNYNGGDVFGISRGIGPLIDRAYAIIDIDKILWIPQLMSHEIGHLLGGRHNRPENLGDDPTDVCNHARIFNGFPRTIQNPSGPAFSTVVTSGRSLGLPITPIMHFSNPEVIFQSGIDPVHFDLIDITTGDQNNDNAGIINENACQMSKANIYADMNPQFSPKYKKVCTHLETFYECIDITVPPNNRAMQPPYLIYWYWNNIPVCPRLDLINPDPKNVGLTDNTLCFDFPIDAVPSTYSEFYVCARIEDANGNYITIVSDRIEKDFSTVCVHTTGLQKKFSNSNEKYRVLESSDQVINNSTDIIKLISSELQYELFSLDGRKIILSTNPNDLNQMRTNLPMGIYILKEKNVHSSNYKKLIIR